MELKNMTLSVGLGNNNVTQEMSSLVNATNKVPTEQCEWNYNEQ